MMALTNETHNNANIQRCYINQIPLEARGPNIKYKNMHMLQLIYRHINAIDGCLLVSAFGIYIYIYT